MENGVRRLPALDHKKLTLSGAAHTDGVVASSIFECCAGLSPSGFAKKAALLGAGATAGRLASSSLSFAAGSLIPARRRQASIASPSEMKLIYRFLGHVVTPIKHMARAIHLFRMSIHQGGVMSSASSFLSIFEAPVAWSHHAGGNRTNVENLVTNLERKDVRFDI